MYLTLEQEKMLSGEYGWSVAKAMELLVRIGEALNAPRLIEVKHAHVSGVSYSNIGKYGLEFILDFYRSGGKARIYTTINPGCVDYSGYSSIIDNKFIREQLQIDSAFIGMGFKPVFTCIPYYYRPPISGEHLAWGESSAVIYANSIFGACTNREGGPIALAASITGYTYMAGLHLPENRVARVEVNFSPGTLSIPIGAIGLWIGDHVKTLPIIKGTNKMNYSNLKILLSSMAASGSHGLVVLEDITPRYTYSLEVEDKIYVEKNMVEDYVGDEVTTSDNILGYIGCPHLHPFELLEIVHLVRKHGSIRRGKLLITVPIEYMSKFKHILHELKARGVDVAAGTCPVVSVFHGKYDVVVTNSGKAAFYLRKIHGVKTRIAEISEVVKLVSRGAN
ncbi:MAG: aconitase X catalytic domain-containing protein [Desulfurococcaceae archaeon]